MGEDTIGEQDRSSATSWVVVAAFVAVVGFTAHLGSERAYWFHSVDWFGPRLGETAALSLFYAIGAALALWALARTRYVGWHQIVLAGAVYAWTIEGVVVYVLHEGGPFDPFFPAMFAGWHGLLSFAGLFFVVRLLLVQRRPVVLAVAAAACGLGVGSWAVTAWLPDSDEALQSVAAGVSTRTEPTEFALTMLLVTVSLAAAHLVLDRLWPADWRPSRAGTWIVVGGTAAYATLGFFAVWYGPIRYAALVAVAMAGLFAAAHRRPGPNVFTTLSGEIRAWHLLSLLPATLVASAVYATAWSIGPANDVLEAVRDLHVLGQASAGAALVVWALVRSHRADRADADATSTATPP